LAIFEGRGLKKWVAFLQRKKESEWSGEMRVCQCFPALQVIAK
jgi:hypothetical protein